MIVECIGKHLLIEQWSLVKRAFCVKEVTFVVYGGSNLGGSARACERWQEKRGDGLPSAVS